MIAIRLAPLLCLLCGDFPAAEPPILDPSGAGSPRRDRSGPWDNDVLVLRVGAGGKRERIAAFERAGVPAAARLKDGRIIAAHQHFPADDDAGFDKVAVRFSSDEGRTWTRPEVIRLRGLPEGMRSPFDPTLVPLPDGRVRLYFTSVRGRRLEDHRPAIYSAVSADGIEYAFEPGVRFGVEGRPVIDCAVVLHDGVFHLFAPDNGAGAPPGTPGAERRPPKDQPREGAGYHATSRDGLEFERRDDVRIDGRRNWLGCAVSDGPAIRFFGTGEGGRPEGPGGVWTATSEDGRSWKLDEGFPPVPVADPGAVKLSGGNWLVVGTGPPRPGTPGALRRERAGDGPAAPGAEEGSRRPIRRLVRQVVPVRIPSTVAGAEGIAATIAVPSRPRYPEGAPVAIVVSGGVGPGGARGRIEHAGYGFVEIHFAFPGGGEGDERSGGSYDFRGPRSHRALADVIRFAMGRAPDKEGKRIGDRVIGMEVLVRNCGLLGMSHGGNACGLAMAMFGEEFPDLAWYASMESPYGEGAVNVELGGHETGVLPAYDARTGALDLSRLAWSPDLRPGLLGRPAFGPARDLRGALYFDLDGNGRFSPDGDFPANCVLGNAGEGIRAWYSPRLVAEAERRKLIDGERPRHVPAHEESREFWGVRDAAPRIPEAVRKCRDLAVIVYANERDHVQATPDHGHILVQVEGFREAKARFVRLNPDRAYVERVLAAGAGRRVAGPGGSVRAKDPAGVKFPDNPAGRPLDRSSIGAALEPDIYPQGPYMQAAACELADRTRAGNWSADLEEVLVPDAPWEPPPAPAEGSRRGGVPEPRSPAPPRSPDEARGGSGSGSARLFFQSRGKTGLVNADGTGLRYLEFDVPGQATWQPAGLFSDGRRILFLSMEPRRDGPGKPFDQYYHRTPTHLWIHDLASGSLTEIAGRDRLAVFYTPQLLIGDDRLLVQVVRDGGGQVFSMNLDGTGAREFTRPGEGLPYGFSLAPDGRRVAYHLASPSGYQIWTSDLEGGDRILVAAERGHLFFGPVWSPDGKWLAYQDCLHEQDPGHDGSDICLSRPDGSEKRLLTRGQSMWFAATYGDRQDHGGGSNMVAWTSDGAILFPRKLPGSKVPWEYQAGRVDTDHFNREFRPELARGGTEICRLDSRDGSVSPLTRSDPPVWDFRASESPDGKRIVFCRAATGGQPAIWVMDSDGRNGRRITMGIDDRGADHPRWLPATR
jgi:hypothetical protein